MNRQKKSLLNQTYSNFLHTGPGLHGGEIKVDTKENEGTTFINQLDTSK